MRAIVAPNEDLWSFNRYVAAMATDDNISHTVMLSLTNSL